jgi:pimeloyl-ACP methyl ester carboxylesterase
MPTITTSDGVRLNYVDEGAGRPVVLLARMSVPSLFLAGRQSQFWPCEHATAAAESNPLARAVVFDDCGHAANLDQPDRTNAAILEFLR